MSSQGVWLSHERPRSLPLFSTDLFSRGGTSQSLYFTATRTAGQRTTDPAEAATCCSLICLCLPDTADSCWQVRRVRTWSGGPRRLAQSHRLAAVFTVSPGF